MSGRALNMDASNAPGWFGKLPVLGDFATRRLPQDFVAAWDAWLQRGMTYSQEHLGSAWLDAFLTAPVWRFVLGAHTLDNRPWAGVVLPSVDRVGRYFPLTVCAPIPDLSFSGPALHALEQWADTLEACARQGLDPLGRLDAFDTALAQCVPPALAGHVVAGGLGEAVLHNAAFVRLERTGARGLHDLAADAGDAMLSTMFAPYTLWWCRGLDGQAGGFACHGMPSAAVFSRMLQYVPGQV